MRLTHDVYRPGASPGARTLLASSTVTYDPGDLVRVGLLTDGGEVVDTLGGAFVEIGDDRERVSYVEAATAGELFVDDSGEPVSLEEALTVADGDDEHVAEEGSGEVELASLLDRLEELDRADLETVAEAVQVEGFGRWGDARLIDTIRTAAVEQGLLEPETGAAGDGETGDAGDAGDGEGGTEGG